MNVQAPEYAKYFVISDGDSPIALKFNMNGVLDILPAFDVDMYVDAFDDCGMRIASYKYKSNSEELTTIF